MGSKRTTRRLLPPYRHEPGKTPHPERSPEGHLYGTEHRPRPDDFLYGVDLFNAGYFWESHVFWERLWSETTSENDALFLQGLIQLSAALVKRREGSASGAAKLTEKSLEKLRRTRARCGEVYRGLRLDALIESIEGKRPPVLEIVP